MSPPASARSAPARMAMARSSRKPLLRPTTASAGRSGCGSCRRENQRPVSENPAVETGRGPARDRFRSGCRETPPANPPARLASAGRRRSGTKHPATAHLCAPTSAVRSERRCFRRRVRSAAVAHSGQSGTRRRLRPPRSIHRTRLLLLTSPTSSTCLSEGPSQAVHLVLPRQHAVGLVILGVLGILTLATAQRDDGLGRGAAAVTEPQRCRDTKGLAIRQGRIVFRGTKRGRDRLLIARQ